MTFAKPSLCLLCACSNLGARHCWTPHDWVLNLLNSLAIHLNEEEYFSQRVPKDLNSKMETLLLSVPLLIKFLRVINHSLFILQVSICTHVCKLDKSVQYSQMWQFVQSWAYVWLPKDFTKLLVQNDQKQGFNCIALMQCIVTSCTFSPVV